MHSRQVFEIAARLQAAGEPFAFVPVLRAVAPSSARVGDKAVVTPDGRIHGWIGGGCAQPAVVRTVREALDSGRALQIRITPDTDAERELGDMLEFGMACHSGGIIELFVDPVPVRPALVVFGDSPVAVALAELAPHVGFDVTAVAPGGTDRLFPSARVIDADAARVERSVREVAPPGAFAVVATQGRGDLPALRAALAIDAQHVSFVASRRKAAVLRESLKAAGESPAAVDAIVAPAGQQISAQTPEEIALSVLASLVARRRAGSRVAQAKQAPAARAQQAPAAQAEQAPAAQAEQAPAVQAEQATAAQAEQALSAQAAQAPAAQAQRAPRAEAAPGPSDRAADEGP
ncbi:MAG: XdhC family protein, partial [Burkholderiales bacterium]